MAAPETFEKADRANEILRYCISVLGSNPPIIATRKGKFEVVLALKRDLSRMDAWWQIKILEHHLHKWQKWQRRLQQ